MAFLRFTRDKRGYEHFYLVQPTANRRGKARSRVLYWFRTPPNVRVGREPFDESVRRALEAKNPDVQFDWRKIVETPIPSADAERWRERRRTERAEKAARRGALDEETRSGRDESDDVDAGPADEEALDTTPEDFEGSEAEREDSSETSDGFEPVRGAEAAGDRVESGVPASTESPSGSREREGTSEPSGGGVPASKENVAASGTHDRGRRRRRRRGRRGRHDVRAGGQQAPVSQSDAAPPSPVPDDDRSQASVEHVSDSGLTPDEPEGE